MQRRKVRVAAMQLCACGDRAELETTADPSAAPLAWPPRAPAATNTRAPAAPLCGPAGPPLGPQASPSLIPASHLGPLQPAAGVSVLGILLSNIEGMPSAWTGGAVCKLADGLWEVGAMGPLLKPLLWGSGRLAVFHCPVFSWPRSEPGPDAASQARPSPCQGEVSPETGACEKLFFVD